MTGVSIQFEIRDSGVHQAFTRLLSAMGNTAPVMSVIATGLVASTHRRFVTQSSPDGAAWAGLHPAYRPIKRNSRILTESGRLRGSINEASGNDWARVGTNLIYAGVHQFGATIRPKAASHLVFRLATGVVLAKSVTIPARPYLGISDDDEQMISETVFRYLRRYL